jgi:hypothetical protein
MDHLINAFFDLSELRDSDKLETLPTIILNRKTIKPLDGHLPLFGVSLMNTTQNGLFEALDKNSKFFIIHWRRPPLEEETASTQSPEGWVCYCKDRRAKEAAITFLVPVTRSLVEGVETVVASQLSSYPDMDKILEIFDRVKKLFDEGEKLDLYRDSVVNLFNNFIQFGEKIVSVGYRDLFFYHTYGFFCSSKFREETNPHEDTFIASAWEDVLKLISHHESEIAKARRTEEVSTAIAKKIEDTAAQDGDINTRFEAVRANMPESVAKVFAAEQKKLGYTSQQSPEYARSLDYMDTVLSIPWGKYTEESVSINELTDKMDASHFGMSTTKNAILEHLAIQIKAGSSCGEVICLIGPPGVGKSSIANVLAESMGRKFIKMALGGVGDEALLRGHKRTYVGAEPGKLVTHLAKCGAMDPIVVLDEVDKLASHKGSPVDALLEILDPEQNHSFTDHYLNFPLDLSRALFICTANYLDQIPAPLRDRMTFINIEGYTFDEQLTIARDYVVPKYVKKFKLEGVTISDELVVNFCSKKKTGVRTIERAVRDILKKSALKMLRDNVETLDLTVANCKELINFDPAIYIAKEKQMGFGNG